ncbi:MAG: hypothetical protein HY897_04230 [Deltaproteobacteria bacterium]|nr:hypothetical protein [Deltaproteobacteria bacterium]
MKALPKVAVGRHETRNTDAGLFLNKDSLLSVVRWCVAQIRQDAGDDVVVTKDDVFFAVKHLCGDELFYLPRGNRCMVGYILPGVTIDGLWTSEGKPVSCKTALLPTDPMFAGGGSRACGDGSFEIASHVGTFHVTRHAFDRFVEGTKRAELKARTIGRAPMHLRDYFRSFQRILRDSKVLECVWPAVANRFEGAAFRGTRHWIFVVENGRDVTTCFDLEKIPETVFRDAAAGERTPTAPPAAGDANS